MSYLVSYGYDAANRLVSLGYPSGRVVTYDCDATGRMSSVTTKETAISAAANLATGIVWQGFGGSGGGAVSGSGSPVAAYAYTMA